MIFAFLFRMPMVMVNLWFPMAHVEAPVSGSMILAGVLWKLGGYGLLRVFLVLFKFGFMFGVVWVSLSLIGGLFVSLFCIRQTDLKSLIAYSSVAHISMVIGGIMLCSLLSSGKLYSRLQRVTIPDTVIIQFVLLKIGMLMLETCREF
jgi:NADH-ubiquinone oxidoreductase chain 4